jgi:hypothetical protein
MVCPQDHLIQVLNSAVNKMSNLTDTFKLAPTTPGTPPTPNTFGLAPVQSQQASPAQMFQWLHGNLAASTPGYSPPTPKAQGGPFDCCKELLNSLRELTNYSALILDWLNTQNIKGRQEGGTHPHTKRDDPSADLMSFFKHLRLSSLSYNFGGQVGHLGYAAASIGKAVGGPDGKAVEQIGQFVGVVGQATNNLQIWSKEMHDTNIRFADFSVSMTRVMVESEIRQMEISRRHGEARAESAKALAESKDELDKQMAPLTDSMANFWNESAAGWNMLMNDLIKGFKDWKGFFSGNGMGPANNRDRSEAFGNASPIFFQMGREGDFEVHGRPDRFWRTP